MIALTVLASLLALGLKETAPRKTAASDETPAAATG
jgi:hypothetical protein